MSSLLGLSEYFSSFSSNSFVIEMISTYPITARVKAKGNISFINSGETVKRPTSGSPAGICPTISTPCKSQRVLQINKTPKTETSNAEGNLGKYFLVIKIRDIAERPTTTVIKLVSLKFCTTGSIIF